MDQMEWIKRQFGAGYNCAQIVVSFFAEKYGMRCEDVSKLACGFGGGMRQGEVCGAVTGAVMVIGMKYGAGKAGDAAAKRECYAKTVEFETAFRHENGSLLCKDLLGCDLSTPAGMAAAKDQGLFDTVCPVLVQRAIAVLQAQGY